MTRARPRTRTPLIEPIEHGELPTGDHGDLHARADLDHLAFTDVQASRLDLGSGAAISDCRFTGVGAHELDLSSSRLSDTVITQLDVPVATSRRGVWRDVELATGRIGSWEAYESQWRQVHIRGCKLTYVNLRGSNLLDVVFTDCQIEELDLSQATATRVSFPGSRVAHLDVQRAELEHVDLRGATFEDVRGVDRLRGVTVTYTQLMQLAPLLAEELGLVVED